MIPIKNTQEIEIMRQGGRRLGTVFGQVLEEIRPGVELKKLDQLAEKFIKKQKGLPSFKMVKGYQWSTCININQGVVHGVPGKYRILNGDLVSLDVGMFFQGFHTDMARTILLPGGEKNQEKKKFLNAGKKALIKAVKVAKVGNRIGHISQTIEQEIKSEEFKPIEALTGHGVGRKLHEDPKIPCLPRKTLEETELIKTGMALAIEVIYAQGKPDIVLADDGWTVETTDRKLAGLFENTIVVTKKGPEILTIIPNNYTLDLKLEV